VSEAPRLRIPTIGAEANERLVAAVPAAAEAAARGIRLEVIRPHRFVIGTAWDDAPLRRLMVSLILARGEVPVAVGLQLFLPETWAGDAERCARAGVPEEHHRPLAKTDIALAEIDRVIADGIRLGCVIADAGYGSAPPSGARASAA
jgi:SRSO17 transposase